jgi:DNA-binding NarL/FixJ family response regulator
MHDKPAPPTIASPYPNEQPECCVFPASERFRTLLRDLVGQELRMREDNDPGQPIVSVLPRHEPEAVISALAQGAAGVLALTDPPASWRECLRVVMGGGRWLGGPGLEISLEEKHTAYDVARSDHHAGEVTLRTKLYVKQRVADKFRP